MKSFIRTILRDQGGATAIEYSLLIGLIGLAIVFSMKNFTNQVNEIWHEVDNATRNASAD